jgi:hypothetical protein
MGNSYFSSRYYQVAADPTSPNNVCAGKPERAGPPCKISYAGAPSSGPELSTTWVVDYTTLLPQPLQQTQTAGTGTGAATRTTTTTYNNDGQVATTQLTSNPAGSTSMPA